MSVTKSTTPHICDVRKSRKQLILIEAFDLAMSHGVLFLFAFSCDFVFTNWLLMYLTHTEVMDFLTNVLHWLRPDGMLHIRESCSEPSSTNYCWLYLLYYRCLLVTLVAAKHKTSIYKQDGPANPTYYRHISQYIPMLQTLKYRPNCTNTVYKFEVLWAQSVPAYIEVRGGWGG